MLFLVPIVSALAGFEWHGLIPGAAGFVVGVAVASLAKTLIGLGQRPYNNWEDWISFVVTLLGFLGTGLSANPAFLTDATIIGLFVKALGFLQTGLTVEDIILAIGSLLAGYGAFIGNMEIVNAGLLLSIVGKSIPSIGTNGTPAVIKLASPA